MPDMKVLYLVACIVNDGKLSLKKIKEHREYFDSKPELYKMDDHYVYPTEELLCTYKATVK